MTGDSSSVEGPEVHAGDLLCERYRADRLVGRSETSVVVECTDMLRNSAVAVKMLDPGAEEPEMLAQRLRREAGVLAQLTSPHVVRVLDVGKHGRNVCLVMELLRGMNLAQLVRKRGVLPIDEAVGLVIQACDGLAEAHAIDVVHRDIKPQNIFLAERPDGTSIVKVLDFGVSKQQTPGGPSVGLTATGAAVGSPLYTAVEQFRDARNVDARADIWSLGLVLYFLLCRRNAFDGDNAVALMLKIATSSPVSLRERRPEVPPDLEAVILQCVEKNRDLRFRNVGAFARALSPFGPAWVEDFLPSIEARLRRKSLAELPRISVTPPPSTSRPPALAPPSQRPPAPVSGGPPRPPVPNPPSPPFRPPAPATRAPVPNNPPPSFAAPSGWAAVPNDPPPSFAAPSGWAAVPNNPPPPSFAAPSGWAAVPNNPPPPPNSPLSPNDYGMRAVSDWQPPPEEAIWRRKPLIFAAAFFGSILVTLLIALIARSFLN